MGDNGTCSCQNTGAVYATGYGGAPAPYTYAPRAVTAPQRDPRGDFAAAQWQAAIAEHQARQEQADLEARRARAELIRADEVRRGLRPPTNGETMANGQPNIYIQASPYDSRRQAVIDAGTALARAGMTINQSGQVVPVNGGGGAGVDIDGLNRRLDRLAEGLVKMTDFVQRSFPYLDKAGVTGTYSEEAGLGNAARLDGTLYKGGVLRSDLGTFSDTAPAGETIIVPWSAEQMSRMTGTYACRLLFFVQAGTPSGGQLAAQAAAADVTLLLNGSEVPQFRRVPLIRATNTLDGSERAADIRMWIPSDAQLSFVVTLAQPLTGIAGQTSTVFATIDSSSTCR